MKLTKEQSQDIKNKYLEYRKQGLAKQESRRRVSNATGFGMTTIWDHTYDVDNPPELKATKSFKPEWPKTYIITGWEIRVKANEKFVQCLEQMAETYDAELILVPCQESDVNYIPQELQERFTVITENFKLNDNLQFKYVETNALLQSPLAGHVGAYPDMTTIIPGLVKELRTEPSQHYVKQLISTGSVGYLNAKAKDYSEVEEEKEFNKRWRTVKTRRNGKASAIADNYVEPAALIVDVLDRKTFLTRFVTSKKNGIVYDLDKKFTPDGYVKSQPSALVTGDFHAYYVDEDAYRATKDMIRFFDPKEVVLNDFFDGASVNHHEVGSAVKFHTAPSIRSEANLSISILSELSRLSNKLVYLQSNHDNFLERYLDSTDKMWRHNRNYAVACGLQFYRTQTQKHPVIKLLELNKVPNLEFVRERDNYFIGKVLVKHGHEGIGGTRTGFIPLAKMYNYYAQGHTHQPAVYRNAMCVGLNGQLDMEYAIGGNAWLHANGLIQPDNSMQLLPIIFGQWVR
jgi:hypothetical protein